MSKHPETDALSEKLHIDRAPLTVRAQEMLMLAQHLEERLEESATEETPTRTPDCVFLTDSERHQIVEILKRRANDVVSFQSDVQRWTGGTIKEFPGSVEMALTREAKRLRKLAELVRPPSQDGED